MGSIIGRRLHRSATSKSVVGTGTITTGAFTLLGVAVAVHSFATLRESFSTPNGFRWRPLLLLVPLFVGGYVTALTSVLMRGETEHGLLVGTLCLFGAGFLTNTARIRSVAAELETRDEMERQIQHDATHDRLTGLPNMALFVDRLNSLLRRRRGRRSPTIFAVLILDLDKFKDVNDSLGHSVGDRVLQAVAERIGHCVRETDTVARLGGDEFVILLDDIVDIRDAVRVAERIQDVLSPRIDLDGRELFATTSIGIVLSETGYGDADGVLRDADIAMGRAKSLGGGRYEIFDTAMRERMTDRLSMENELRRALERGEFRLVYQPIIDLTTNRLAGFEALVRWQHPERGMISPFHFIDFAEKTGQIIAIDRWVMREACRQMRDWQCRLPFEGSLMVSTNLSSRQFSQNDLVGYVRSVLSETGLAPECLEVELTETAFIENLEPIKATLDELKQLGVGLKLDDFGTGYSSLSYLHRLPFDILKIDRSFVAKMADSGTDLAIVHTVLLLAQALDIRVVAEGVETISQLQQLRELQCDFAQGYLFSKPVPPDEAEQLIRRATEETSLPLALA